MLIIVFAGAYLVGSIPVAWIVTKLVTGKDLREVGSGNVGVMNVGLSVSRWAGLIVFLSEVAKGMLAVVLTQTLELGELAVYIAVLGVVIGTRWPVWLGFHGGRGNSAAIGALLLLSWPTLVIGMLVWLLIRVISRSSFWATRIAFYVWPVIFGLLESSWMAFGFAFILVLIYRSTQRVSTDDHLLIKERWPSFFHFVFSPPRNTENSSSRNNSHRQD
ncbi:MAG: glycerol-3-phosphate acyltransferase [Anaerolineales bacterium]